MAYGSSQVTGPIEIIAAGLQVASMRTRFHPWPRPVGWGSGIAVSCDVGCRWGSDPKLLFFWGAVCLGHVEIPGPRTKPAP